MGGVAAVVVAAGRGLRVGGDLPKQYRKLEDGGAVIRHALALFAEHPDVSWVQPVIHPDDLESFRAAAAGLDLLAPVHGGASRQASVRAGLESLAARSPETVLVHDAARPFASAGLVSRAIAAAKAKGAAIPALAVTDTVKSVDSDGRVVETLDRTRLRTVQTPQAFRFDTLLDAHRRAAAAGREDFTDDAALAEWAGMDVSVFEGERANTKLTTAEDFARLEAAGLAALGDVRTATGYDVHAFGEGDHVVLGGVPIPYGRALAGHSDADVVLHALVDAILGTLADGDIGHHFPPSDPRWRGASSDKFLAFAVERVRARSGRIAHLDVTLICEAPRIGPHRDAMRARIAEIAGIAAERVAVKATTNEKLGFVGRGEGIAAFATATVRLPWSTP
ncbi:MAG TPA: bifunctional 2-C-methyl-D-erythritol 4-phosphate cytidylyltransferase/2-C-methyl-D-erythritol 2,4-cyclodiphosphate synthase [Xanthobacteraceae bacterium]|jgi:2-C-methyl-D-erythritol 4-phosphate cytidylyltransferase/2-C-methyl-D-erythritol 2,4-cyclodiphosphate synthase|nr:bifunctional 2-C-methyl-D-erythritol 4-phosphate cytidylyltransferase/2-C-methyl-D-erythritol 2,4-cyclodiphosphate synthase [Xanthobacteraceae bacterium]